MQPSNPSFPPPPQGGPGAPGAGYPGPGGPGPQPGYGPGGPESGYAGPGPEQPVGWGPGVPVPPGPFAGPQGHPGAGPAPAKQPVQPTILIGLLGVILVALGLALPFNSTCAFATQTAWSVFALLVAVVAVLGPVLGSGRSGRTAWLITAGGAAALVGYWLLIVLPGVSSNPGFTSTLGVAAVAVAAWFSPARPK